MTDFAYLVEGPICGPRTASLLKVLHPDPVGYLRRYPASSSFEKQIALRTLNEVLRLPLEHNDPWNHYRTTDDPISGCYFVVGADLVKIGYSINPSARIKSLRTGTPVELDLLGVLPAPPHIEGNLHSAFHHERCRGEWFELSPRLLAFVRLMAMETFHHFYVKELDV